jgi:hypothetical protein
VAAPDILSDPDRSRAASLRYDGDLAGATAMMFVAHLLSYGTHIVRERREQDLGDR